MRHGIVVPAIDHLTAQEKVGDVHRHEDGGVKRDGYGSQMRVRDPGGRERDQGDAGAMPEVCPEIGLNLGLAGS